jgi:peroxiredoxin
MYKLFNGITMVEKIKVGDVAKDFSLKDQNRKDFRLSDNRGKRVLLSFHPLAWTSVCAGQMKSLEENKAVLDSVRTVAVGISVDSIPCKKAWAESLEIISTSLLSDFWPHGGVANLYGIFKDKEGIAARSNVLVDENGKVAFVKVYETSQLPDMAEIVDVIKNL